MTGTHAWHTFSTEETLRRLVTTAENGLSVTEAEKRIAEYGRNELRTVKKAAAWRLLLAQFKNVLVVILLIATALSGFLGHETEAITIAVIVILAVLLGFVQEYRAEKAMEKLKAMAAPLATVIRGGSEQQIAATELVPGDIVLLVAGNRAPADARLIEAINLRMDESVLTGESLPSEKDMHNAAAADANIADRLTMIYAGTTVAAGRGRAVVVGTGMQTEFGRIAQMLSEVAEQQTPLQKNLDRLGAVLWILLLALAPQLGRLAPDRFVC